MVLLMAYLGRAVRQMAAVIGGIGFGMFIDELGKFITQDNNYFFQPTIALIYVVFILLFFVFRAIGQETLYSKQEYLVNALEITKEVVIRDLDELEKKRAEEMLSHCEQNDPIVKYLNQLYEKIDPLVPHNPGIYSKTKIFFHSLYLRLANYRWFKRALGGLFSLYAAITIIQIEDIVNQAIAGIFYVGIAVLLVVSISPIRALLSSKNRSYAIATVLIFLVSLPIISIVGVEGRTHIYFYEGGEVFFTIVSIIFLIAGVLKMSSSLFQAYGMFERSVLISILFTQFFIFYKDQLSAIFGLFFNLAYLFVLRYLMAEEENASK